MSQEGIIDIIGTHPEIPTEFIANVGSAIPINNQLEILGEVVLAGTNPFRTIGSGNTITAQIQIAQAIAATDATNIGLAAFDSSDFSVDANGFVSLNLPASSPAFNVDTFTAPGTDPVVASGLGIINVTGGQVAAGTTANVIQTNSLAANSYTIQVQRSSAQAVSTVGANGVCHFDSAGFSVDSNAFVALQSSALGVLSVSGTANRITSTGGQNPVIDIAGTYVGQTSITTLGTIATGVWQGTIVGVTYGGTGVNGSSAANGTLLIGNGTGYTLATLTAGTGISVTNGSGSITLAVDGASVGQTITGDSGGALSPTAGNWNLLGSGSITTVGSGSTLTTQLIGLTNHNVLVGAGTTTITKVPPSATSGVPLISQGSASDPTFGTAVVAGGGTGITSATAYAVLCGGTTSTAPFQSIASVGTSGQVLTSNGAGALPTFQAAATGDITGPGSSTDNALVRWDGTTGTVVQNGVITEDDTGNLSISAAVSGASLSALVANTSNTASATAFYEAQVAGSTASDAYYRASINGGQAWTWGLDNSDSDAFALSANTNLGTTNIMRSSTGGEINYPLQPAFLGRLSSGDLAATGNGTVATLGAGNAFTEIFDQNSDFNTNGTFTAPVTGRYQLTAGIYPRGFLVAHTRQLLTMITSNFPYGGDFQGYNLANNAGDQLWTQTVLADMDAGDTYTVTYAVYNGTKVINIGANNTFMCGYLAC